MKNLYDSKTMSTETNKFKLLQDIIHKGTLVDQHITDNYQWASTYHEIYAYNNTMYKVEYDEFYWYKIKNLNNPDEYYAVTY